MWKMVTFLTVVAVGGIVGAAVAALDELSRIEPITLTDDFGEERECPDTLPTARTR